MTDVFDREKRSKIMGLVKGKNTKPEILLRRKLHSLGFRFRIHERQLPGNPDIKLTKYKTVIFVNGCFWHGHSGCRYYTIPKTNQEFWISKIKVNMDRDMGNSNLLTAYGWKVIVIWTCELKKNKIDKTINQIVYQLLNGNN